MRHSLALKLVSVCICFCSLLLLVSPAIAFPASARDTEKTIWDLEHSYWSRVEKNDLNSYLALWHPDFLGWPSISPEPVRKDHITDWITSQTAKGLAFKALNFKQAAIQVNADNVVVCYWVTYKWEAKDGSGAQHTVRVIHNWVQHNGSWQIISGMSMPQPAVS